MNKNTRNLQILRDKIGIEQFRVSTLYKITEKKA